MRGLFSLLAGLMIFSSSFADSVDDYVQEKMASDHLPGVVFAVVDPSGNASYREYGVANRLTGEKFTKKSVHRIASLSKQMCSYVLLNLEKEGKLSLDDEILKWYPKGPETWKGITIRHMMSHCSGIPDPNDFNYEKEYSVDEYVAMLGKSPLDNPPGSKFKYSNYAYGLLGDLAGKAGGSTLHELAKKYIFGPLGMDRTGYYLKGEKYSDEVFAYYWEKGKYVDALRVRPVMFSGSGGVHSTLTDMVKYELALRSGKLDRALLDQQWTPHFPKLGIYGYGWYADQGSLRHTGTTFGFTSAYYRERPDGWSIILFRNSNTGSQMDMATDVLKLWRAQIS
ncbi:MAG: serine hydrolase domain-containing protein [Fimbriimonadaceae bacterium]